MNNFITLRKEFIKIKNMGLIEPLRKGTTGIGYTLESLLGKKEDSESKPDFLGIELKTKLGYSKSPMTLFHCIPKRNNNSAIHYIFEKYSLKKYNSSNVFLFNCEVYSIKSFEKYNYSFKLSINYQKRKVVMKSYYKNIFLEDVCYWDFSDLENKLNVKLNRLAIIYAYPYKVNNKLFYKYLKMNTYKLKNFSSFLRLIEEDKIHIQFYLKGVNKNLTENHGIAFRLNNDYIEELFTKLYY